MTRVLIAALALLLLPLAPALARDLATARADAATLADWLNGRWSSAGQAARDPAYQDIQTSNVRLWAGDPDALHFWFYGESARMPDAAKPYRQNVFHLVPQEDGTVHSYQYRVRDPARAAGFAARGEAPALTLEDLIPIPNCTLILRRAAPDRFEGAMRGTDCRNKFRGADYMDARTTITPSWLLTWDRGMTFDGRHVWGPAKGGYAFDKIAARR